MLAQPTSHCAFEWRYANPITRSLAAAVLLVAVHARLFRPLRGQPVPKMLPGGLGEFALVCRGGAR